jgi:hypothetical protein
MCPVTNNIVTPKAQMSEGKDRSSQPLRHSGAIKLAVPPPLMCSVEEVATPKSHRIAPAAVGAKDDVGGFDIVVEDLLSMDVGDGVADVGPDAKTPAFGYGGYQVVIDKLIDTDSRNIFESEG